MIDEKEVSRLVQRFMVRDLGSESLIRGLVAQLWIRTSSDELTDGDLLRPFALVPNGVVVQDPAGLMELIHGAIGAARWEERLTWERAYKSACTEAGFHFPGRDEPTPTYDQGKDHVVAMREIRAALGLEATHANEGV